jgi:hypothetical protein
MKGGGCRHHGDGISLLSFLQNKESRLKMYLAQKHYVFVIC